MRVLGHLRLVAVEGWEERTQMWLPGPFPQDSALWEVGMGQCLGIQLEEMNPRLPIIGTCSAKPNGEQPGEGPAPTPAHGMFVPRYPRGPVLSTADVLDADAAVLNAGGTVVPSAGTL